MGSYFTHVKDEDNESQERALLTALNDDKKLDPKSRLMALGRRLKPSFLLPLKLRLLLPVTTLAQSFAGNAVSMYIMLFLELGPVQMTDYWVYLSWSSVVEPLIGVVSDTLVINNERRRPLVILGAVIIPIIYLLYYYVNSITSDLATNNSHYALFVFLSIIQTLAQVCIYTPINGMVVQVYDLMLSPTSFSTTAGKSSASSHITKVRKHLEEQFRAEGDKAIQEYLAENNINVQSEEIRRRVLMSSPAEEEEKDSVSAAAEGEGNKDGIEGGSGFNVAEYSEQELSEIKEKVDTVRELAIAAAREAYRTRAMATLQSETMMWRYFGSLTGSILYTVLVLFLTLKQCLLVCAGLYLVIIPAAIMLGGVKSAPFLAAAPYLYKYFRRASQNEEQQEEPEAYSCWSAFRERTQDMWIRFVKSIDFRNMGDGAIGVILVLVFTFVYTAMPSGGMAYSEYVYTQLKFTKFMDAFNMTIGMVGTICGTVFYIVVMSPMIGTIKPVKVHNVAGKSVDELSSEDINGSINLADVQSTTAPQGREQSEGAERGEGEKRQPSVARGTWFTRLMTYVKRAFIYLLYLRCLRKRQSEERIEEIALPLDPESKPVRVSAATIVFSLGCITSFIGYLTNLMVATKFVPNTLPIPLKVFVPFDNFFTSFFYMISFMPLLTVAAERCPVGYESSVFELFSAVMLCGGTVSSIISARFAAALNITYFNYDKLWILVLVCAFLKLVPIIPALLLPVRQASLPDIEQKKIKGNDA